MFGTTPALLIQTSVFTALGLVAFTAPPEQLADADTVGYIGAGFFVLAVLQALRIFFPHGITKSARANGGKTLTSVDMAAVVRKVLAEDREQRDLEKLHRRVAQLEGHKQKAAPADKDPIKDAHA